MMTRFAMAPMPPTSAKADMRPKRSIASCVRKRMPWVKVAFDSPAYRVANANGTSPMRSWRRARISSRILNPRGRSASRSRASRSTRKNPVIGSVQPWSLRGNIDLVSAVEARETAVRVAFARPPAVPPAT